MFVKWKVGPLLKMYEEFQDGNSRVLNQAWGASKHWTLWDYSDHMSTGRPWVSVLNPMEQALRPIVDYILLLHQYIFHSTCSSSNVLLTLLHWKVRSMSPPLKLGKILENALTNIMLLSPSLPPSLRLSLSPHTAPPPSSSYLTVSLSM